MAISQKSSRNEHALKWVLESVEDLVKECSSASGNDLQERMHLELSTVKILDELEMPTIEHAKKEVMLLTRLHDALSRLIEYEEKVLGSSEVIVRLKKFRDEMQKLFTLSPVCKINRSSLGSTKKPVKPVINQESMKQREEHDPDTIGERTDAPSDEANRPGHEMDQTERLTELDASALQRLHEGWQGGSDIETSSTTDTNAIKTPNRGDQDEPEEKSQQIWLAEDPSKGLQFNPRMASTPTKPPAKRQDDFARKTKSPAKSKVSAQAKVVMIEEQKPQSMVAVRRPAMPVGTALEAELDEEGVDNIVRKLIIACGVIVMPIALLWAVFFAFEWNHGCAFGGAAMFPWQLICNLANVFCENYGIGCTEYCSSGLQREKWKSLQGVSK